MRIAIAKSPPVKKKMRTPTVYCSPTTLWSSVILKYRVQLVDGI